MSLADMWNRALTKRSNGAAVVVPHQQPMAKRCKSFEDTQMSGDDAYLQDALNDMSDEAVDSALEDLLKDDPALLPPPEKTKLRSICGISGISAVCCVVQRKAPTHAAPQQAPIRKANLPPVKGVPVSVTVGQVNGVQHPRGKALNGNEESPDSVMRTLYPNLFNR